MGKGKKVNFKKIAGKITKGLDTASKVAVPAAYVAKYNKEIATAAKYGAKYAPVVAKNVVKYGAIGAKNVVKYAPKVMSAASKAAQFAANNSSEFKLNPNMEKMLVDATLGYAKNKGEKYLDKKLGKYKAYRIAKSGLDTVYALGTGDYAGALTSASDVYGEADPNKKRVAKVKGGIQGATNLVNGVMKGDLAGAYGGALQTYSVADPNKKRVAKIQNINNKYIAPAYNLAQAANSFYDAGSNSADVSGRTKFDDLKVKVLNDKYNAALSGSNIGQHKANLLAAHDSQDYGAMVSHAKKLQKEAKAAHLVMQGGDSGIGQSSVSSMYGPIGGGSMKPMAAPIGGASKKPTVLSNTYSMPTLPSPSTQGSTGPIGGGGKRPRMPTGGVNG